MDEAANGGGALATAGGDMVEIRGLNHYFGEGEARKQALFDIDLRLASGEIVIMTGPSGSGKTTLLTLVGALRTIQEGSARVLGHDLGGLSAADLVAVRREIGFIFQAHNLFHSLTATQNVDLAQELRTVDFKEKRARSMEILTRLGLDQRLGYKPKNLSGGQRQRVAIARALVNRPRLVLADEPTAALDKASGRDVVDLFKQMTQEDGCTVVLVTHDPRILDVGDRIVDLVDGAITSDVVVQRSLEICDFLRRVTVFGAHTPATLTEIAQKVEVEHFAPGRLIFEKGDVGDKVYIIRQGTAQVLQPTAGGYDLVAELGSGEIFGEVALMKDEPRNATLRARDELEVYTLKKPDFKLALEQSKSFHEQLLDTLLTRTGV